NRTIRPKPEHARLRCDGGNMNHVVVCPSCRSDLEVDPKLIGTILECPFCKLQFAAPLSEPPPFDRPTSSIRRNNNFRKSKNNHLLLFIVAFSVAVILTFVVISNVKNDNRQAPVNDLLQQTMLDWKRAPRSERLETSATIANTIYEGTNKNNLQQRAWL